jgi:hypothetical protein
MIKAIAEIEQHPYLLLGIAAAGAVLYIRHNASLGAGAVGTSGALAVQPGGLSGIGATGSNFQTGTDPSVLSAIQSAFGQLYGQVNGAITGQPGPNGLLDPNAPVGLTNAQFQAIQAQNVANGTSSSQGQNTLGGTGGYTFQQAQALLTQQQHIADAQVHAAGLSTNPAYGCQGWGCVLPGVSVVGNAIGKIGSLFTGGFGSIFGGGGSSGPSLPRGGVVGAPAGAPVGSFNLGGSYTGD